MSNHIVEEGPHKGHAAGDSDLEKQASQLASDVRYKVKKSMGSGTKMSPAQVSRAYLAQLAKSPAPGAVKSMAKKKLIGEAYGSDINNIVKEVVSNTITSVFSENFVKSEPEKEDVVEESSDDGGKKYMIVVKDKSTGNTYRRKATRAKIAELRANPNISSVEITHYGKVEDDEAKSGKKTASAKAGKDYDGDGKVESSSKEHAGAVHNAIQRSKGGTPDGKDTRKEEVEITEKKHEESKIGGGNLKKLAAKANKRIDADVDGDVDTDDPKSTEMGEFIPSPDGKKKIKTKVQKEDYLSNWREEIVEGKDEEEVDKEIDVMKGKNKVKVMPELGESAKVCEKCGKSPCECDKEDPRGMKTKVNLMRNKLRAMGLKMSHVPEGEVVSEVTRPNLESPDYRDARQKMDKMKPIKPNPSLKKPGTDPITGLRLAHHEPEGETIEEMRGQQQVDPRQQNRAEKDEKKKTSEVVGNMKKVMTKKRMLDKQKFELQKKGKLPLTMSNEVEGEQIDEALPIAVKLGMMAGTAAAGTAIGKAAIDKVKGIVQKKRATEAPYQKLLNQETEVEGKQLDELAPLAGLAVKAGLAAGTAVVGKMVYDKGKKVADKIKQQNQQKVDMINNIRNSYEAEGETVSEEDADRMKDRRMERGGVDGNTRYDRAPKAPNTKKFGSGKTMAQKEMEKKYGKGASAMDIVRAQIQAKHGKGAIMDTKKKK